MRDISFIEKIINALYLQVFKYTQKFNCKMVSVILVIVFLEVWTLPNRFLVLMLSLMLPLKVWTWETESAEHISSGVHCLESDEWSLVTTFAVAEREKRTNITLQSYLYKHTEYASGLLRSDDLCLAWQLYVINLFGSSHCSFNHVNSSFILLIETCI